MPRKQHIKDISTSIAAAAVITTRTTTNYYKLLQTTATHLFVVVESYDAAVH
jgi:hypothetical protein